MARCIFFDLDGTLTDPMIGITNSVQYALRKHGIEVSDTRTLCPFIGPPLRESFRVFYGFDEAGAESAVAAYREYFAEKGIYENTIYDGIPEMLQALRRAGKTLVLATSKPAVYAARILAHFGIAEYFAFVSGSELDGRRDKKADVIRYALEQTGITDLADVVMIGDREHDILGAKEVGVSSIGVLYGYGNAEELHKAGADDIAGSVGELVEKLRRG